MTKNRLRLLVSLAVFLSGLFLLAYAISRGDASFYLVLFIPVINITGSTGFIGVLMVFFGIFLLFTTPHASQEIKRPTGSTDQAPRNSSSKSGFGGLVMIGPIPILFGSSEKMTLLAAMAGVAVLLIVLFLVLFSFRGAI